MKNVTVSYESRLSSPCTTRWGTRRDGYPGFVEEAAINAAKDWAQKEPIEDTTKIVCSAIPTVLEVRRPPPLHAHGGYDPKIIPESNIPMTGEKVHLLDSDWTTRIINRDIQSLQDETITMGSLTNSADVDILVLWDSLIRTHFGIFAYTNAGKSNLLSTITSKVFEKSKDAKIVIYDLMGEYGALLIDVLYKNSDASVVYVSLEAMPGSVMEFWKEPSNDEKTKESCPRCGQYHDTPKGTQTNAALVRWAGAEDPARWQIQVLDI